ncbi:tetratricopeptide repeat protein [Kamptonema cortianum]|nr:tetratricopeptide repeat protein [Geitlerinema splendidum]MDK3158755.1 tetratricopeptide repeat protein [Kamptonema cortianum]
MVVRTGSRTVDIMRTIECLECNTQNSADSAFCRGCGVALPTELTEQMRAENKKLLEDGRLLLSEGRIEEARLVTESVLESEPSCAVALTLMGDIYERNGQFAEALAMYEQAVEIRPDSPLDRIRIAHLSKLVEATEIEVTQIPNKRRNYAMAGLAGILLACVGSALILSTPPKAQASSVDSNNSGDSIQSFRSYSPPLNSQTPPSQGQVGAVQSESDVTTPTTRHEPRQPNTVGFRGFGTSRPSGIPPVTISPESVPFVGANNGTLSPTGGSSQRQPSGTEPTTTFKPEESDPPKDTKPKEDPGVIEITVRDGNSNKGTLDGGQSADEGKSVEVLIQKGRNLQAQDDYAAAAAAYEKAIQNGGGSGTTYQRLAQCYEKIGRKSDAISAYRKAIQAFESQIARGQGNSRVAASLESCKSALRALGG